LLKVSQHPQTVPDVLMDRESLGEIWLESTAEKNHLDESTVKGSHIKLITQL